MSLGDSQPGRIFIAKCTSLNRSKSGSSNGWTVIRPDHQTCTSSIYPGLPK